MNKTTSEPTASVPKDPQPSVGRIYDLARRILNGDILLPQFHRYFVWGKHQIFKLLDFVYKNYPIGRVLLKQNRLELRSGNRRNDLEKNLPNPDYPVNYLLDRRLRLSIICGSMYWHDNNEINNDEQFSITMRYASHTKVYQVEIFNAQFVFSRNILTAVLIALILLWRDYGNDLRLLLLLTAAFIAWQNWKERSYYWTIEASQEFLKGRTLPKENPNP